MYHPTTRALAVLTLLQTHRRMTGAQLAQRLEVNVRTIRDYITMLQDLGAPITAERGRGGAYELDAGFKLPPMMFTEDEAVALAMGLLAAKRLGLAETISAVESARAKLEEAMPAELKNRANALTETLRLDLSTNDVPSASPGQIVLSMSSAAKDQRRVHMRYRSSLDDETERDFDPYGLVCRNGRWYVVGHCHLRQDLRSFRLDRVVQVIITTLSFQRPPDFDALAHVIQNIATMPRSFTFDVLLKTDLLTAHREIMDVFGVLEPQEGGILLRGSTDDLDWVARLLSALSFAFVVLQPEPLRAALHKHASQLAQRASAQPD